MFLILSLNIYHFHHWVTSHYSPVFCFLFSLFLKSKFITPASFNISLFIFSFIFPFFSFSKMVNNSSILVSHFLFIVPFFFPFLLFFKDDHLPQHLCFPVFLFHIFFFFLPSEPVIMQVFQVFLLFLLTFSLITSCFPFRQSFTPPQRKSSSSPRFFLSIFVIASWFSLHIWFYFTLPSFLSSQHSCLCLPATSTHHFSPHSLYSSFINCVLFPDHKLELLLTSPPSVSFLSILSITSYHLLILVLLHYQYVLFPFHKLQIPSQLPSLSLVLPTRSIPSYHLAFLPLMSSSLPPSFPPSLTLHLLSTKTFFFQHFLKFHYHPSLRVMFCFYAR